MSKQELLERNEALESALSQIKDILEDVLDQDEVENDDDDEDDNEEED